MNLTGSIEEKRHFNASSIGHTVQVTYIVLRVQPTFQTSPSVLSLVVWRSWIIESSTVSHMAIYTLAVSMNVRVKLSLSDTLLMCQNSPGSPNVSFA